MQTAAKTTRSCAWAVVLRVYFWVAQRHQAVSDIDVEWCIPEHLHFYFRHAPTLPLWLAPAVFVMISISTSFPPCLSTSLWGFIKSISCLVPDRYFWAPWSTLVRGGPGSGVFASVNQLRATLIPFKTCECGIPLSLPPILCLLQ